MALQKELTNPRIQCCVCGKWRRLLLKNGKQTMFGGDSTCGDVCTYCMADPKVPKTHWDGYNWIYDCKKPYYKNYRP